MEGDLTGSEELARSALAAGEPAVGFVARACLAVQFLAIALEKEPPARTTLVAFVLSTARSVLSQLPHFQPWRVQVGRLALELGEEAEARAVLKSFAEGRPKPLLPDRNLMSNLAILLELACALGEPTVASGFARGPNPARASDVAPAARKYR